jgi:hypothetical protein
VLARSTADVRFPSTGERSESSAGHFEIVSKIEAEGTFASGSGIRENRGYGGSLELRKIYEAIPDAAAEEHRQVRVVDESGDDYLYPTELFVGIEVPKSVRDAIIKAA